MRADIRILGLIFALNAAGCSSSGKNSPATSKPSPVTMSPDELLQKADVPQYPGSSMPEGKSTLSVNGPETRVEVVMFTPDPVQKVIDFYKKSVARPEVTGKANKQALLGTTPHHGFARIFAQHSRTGTEIQAVTLLSQPNR